MSEAIGRASSWNCAECRTFNSSARRRLGEKQSNFAIAQDHLALSATGYSQWRRLRVSKLVRRGKFARSSCGRPSRSNALRLWKNGSCRRANPLRNSRLHLRMSCTLLSGCQTASALMANLLKRSIIVSSYSLLICLSSCEAKPECDSSETRDAVLKAVSDDHRNALGRYAAGKFNSEQTLRPELCK